MSLTTYIGLENAPEVSSAERFVIPYDIPNVPVDKRYLDCFVVEYDIDNKVVEALFSTLESMGYKPEDCMYSGFDTDHVDKKEIGSSGYWGDEFTEDAITSLQEDRDDSNADYIDERLEAWKRRRNNLHGKGTYWVGNTQSLRGRNASPYNPLNYTCVTGGATICVYDKDKLSKVDPDYLIKGDDSEGEGMVDATPEDMNSALVLVFHPRYCDEFGNTLESYSYLDTPQPED